MYVAGTLYNFEKRVHQNCVDQVSYSAFMSEFLSYTITDIHIYNRLNKELSLKRRTSNFTDEESLESQVLWGDEGIILNEPAIQEEAASEEDFFQNNTQILTY